jgi:hypothetical protein
VTERAHPFRGNVDRDQDGRADMREITRRVTDALATHRLNTVL